MGGKKEYIRAFMGMIGVVFLLTGIVGKGFIGEGFLMGTIFILLGLVLIAIPIYWWYKDYQKGP